jgi:hypothetical protein
LEGITLHDFSALTNATKKLANALITESGQTRTGRVKSSTRNTIEDTRDEFVNKLNYIVRIRNKNGPAIKQTKNENEENIIVRDRDERMNELNRLSRQVKQTRIQSQNIENLYKDGKEVPDALLINLSQTIHSLDENAVNDNNPFEPIKLTPHQKQIAENKAKSNMLMNEVTNNKPKLKEVW